MYGACDFMISVRHSLSLPPPDVAEKAEGSLMLHSINELREHQPPSQGGGANVAMATTPIYHTLALLHTVVGEHDKVPYLI